VDGVPALAEGARVVRGASRVRCVPLTGVPDGGPAAVPAGEAGLTVTKAMTFYGEVTRRRYLGGCIGNCEWETGPIPVSLGEIK
jgi:hypothetical protein